MPKIIMCLPVTNRQKPTIHRKAFTLIELMIVCAILGVLATIVVINVLGAKAKSRDAKRMADVETIASAFHLYYADKGTYFIDNTGEIVSDTSTGQGWFNKSGSGYSSKSIAQGLIDAGFINNTIIDPSGGVSSGHAYMFYFSNAKKASAYANLENDPTTAQANSMHNSVNEAVATGYDMDYAATTTN